MTGEDRMRREIVALLPRLRRFCLALVRDPADADDLCQATVERALASQDRFELGTRLDSWMYRIAQNLHIDGRRRYATRGHEVGVDAIDDTRSVPGLRLVEARSDLACAREAMAALPEDQRVLLALVAIDGMSYRDASETLGVPIGTVMSRLSRARRAIDAALNGGTGDE